MLIRLNIALIALMVFAVMAAAAVVSTAPPADAHPAIRPQVVIDTGVVDIGGGVKISAVSITR